MSWILKHLEQLPNNIRYVAGALLLVVVVGVAFALSSQVQSCGYNKARDEYQKKEDAALAERNKLLEDAKSKEVQIVALQTKVQFYEAAADAGKKVDDKLQNQINEVATNAANQEATASTPTDCHVRAKRVCDLLRANNIPGDCAAIEREACGSTGQ